MPKKVIIPKIPCIVCGTQEYWRTTGKCKKCSLAAKRERAKQRKDNQPINYGIDKIEDTKAQAFKRKEAFIMARVWYK